MSKNNLACGVRGIVHSHHPPACLWIWSFTAALVKSNFQMSYLPDVTDKCGVWLLNFAENPDLFCKGTHQIAYLIINNY